MDEQERLEGPDIHNRTTAAADMNKTIHRDRKQTYEEPEQGPSEYDDPDHSNEATVLEKDGEK